MLWGTKTGDEFRELLDQWDSVCIQEDKNNQISMMLDGQNFILFFIFNGDVFGTHEQQRVTFARMKNPNDKEMPKDWINQANFMAFNLSRAVSGKPPEQKIFYHKDLSNIKIIDKEEAQKILSKQTEEHPVQQVAQGAKAIIQMLRSRGG